MHQSHSWCSEQEWWAEFPSYNHTRPTGLHRTGLQRGMVLLHFPFCNLRFTTSYSHSSHANSSPLSHISHSPSQGQVKTSWNKLGLKGPLQSEPTMCSKYLSKLPVYGSFTSKNSQLQTHLFSHSCGSFIKGHLYLYINGFHFRRNELSETLQLGEDIWGQEIIYHKLCRETYIRKSFFPTTISRLTQEHYRWQVQTEKKTKPKKQGKKQRK